MIKNVLVPYVNRHTEAGPLTAAFALCQHFRAQLALLIAVDIPMPMPSEWLPISGDVYMQLRAQLLNSVQPLAQRLRQRFSDQQLRYEHVQSEVRVVESVLIAPSPLATMHAHYADLIVVPSAAGSDMDSAVAHSYFVNLLMGAGRPILVVPEKFDGKLPAKRAVIAWQPSRESARAVHDAMPLLQAANAVDVLVVEPQIGEFAHGEQPGSDIAAHLARHGLTVQVHTRARIGHSVSAALLEHAKEVQADLIVAGGYGHSRFREFMLGGVTRELMCKTHIPVLFSH
jgi:nucleotide-binding universal stress UspA family protein